MAHPARTITVALDMSIYAANILNIAPIAQLVSALDLVTSSVQVEGSILTAGKRLSLKKI